jgi:hypothetical protein
MDLMAAIGILHVCGKNAFVGSLDAVEIEYGIQLSERTSGSWCIIVEIIA